ncbi:MAG: right-handed parallel beta-helix repeat-containing protein [Gemmataceae bacterium]
MLQPLEERQVPAIFTVTNTASSGVGSLAAQLTAANTAGGSNIINFDTTVFNTATTITLTATIGSMTTAAQDLTITGVNGSVTVPVTIAGGNSVTFMTDNAASSSLLIDHLKLTNFKYSGAGGGSGGGAVVNLTGTTANVTFTADTISNNQTAVSGTSAVIDAVSGYAGTVTINSSLVTGNTGAMGGVFYSWTTATFIMSSSTFSFNTSSSSGGVVYNFSGPTTQATNCVFTNNTAGSTGGAILSPGTLTVTGSTFTNNTGSGGAVVSTGTLSLDSSTFNTNTSTSTGGAVRMGSGTITNSSFTGNTAGGAGGAVYSSGTASISTVSFTNNKSASLGGAVRTTSSLASISFASFTTNTAASSGGGLAASGITLANATFSGNTSALSGGGIYDSGAATFNQITVAGNTAAGTSGGGGIQMTSGNVTVNNSTIFGNTATGASTAASGAGLVRTSSGTLQINSTIIASNVITGTGTQGRDLYSTAAISIAGNKSLIGTNDNSSVTFTGTVLKGTNAGPINPLLAPLSDQGGFTLPGGAKIKTMALRPGSPAIDAGQDTFGFTYDERDTPYSRSAGAGVDIGAYEGLIVNPIATLLSNPVPTAGNAAYSFSVSYDAGNNLDTTTFGTADVTVNGPGFGAGQNPTSFSASGAGNAYTVTYTVPAPTGGWGFLNVGAYTVTMNPSQVSDTSSNFVGGSTLGTFKTNFAESFVVDLNSDANDGNFGVGQLTLREAIVLANTNAGILDSIAFDSTVFNSPSTITLTAVGGNITDSLTVTGPAAALTIAGAGFKGWTDSAATLSLSSLSFSGFTSSTSGAVFSMGSATVSLSSVTFSGNTSGANGGAIYMSGAASATITSSTFKQNTAATNGGAIYFGSAATVTANSTSFEANRAGGGSAIFANSTFAFSGNSDTIKNNVGTGTSGTSAATLMLVSGSSTVSITNSSVTGNSTGFRGGLLYVFNSGSNITVSNTVLDKNTAGGGGGAIYTFSTSTVTLNSDTITNNSATGSGGAVLAGGILNMSSTTLSGNTATGTGGALYISGASTITNSTFSNNTAGAAGGALRGGAGTTLSASTFTGNTAGTTGGALYTSGNATVTTTTFTSNTAASNGGAIRGGSTLTLTNSQFTGNTSNGTLGGGAIYGAGSLNASTVVFTNNIAKNATGAGGAIRTQAASTITFADFNANTAATLGGAVQNASGLLLVNNSTFRNNTAGTSGGAINQSASVTINQSTLFNNTASGSSTASTGGGGINANAAGALIVNNSTIYGNTANGSATNSAGGGISRQSSLATITVNSSIVAGNTASGSGTQGFDVYSFAGAVTIAGNNNLIGTNDNSSTTFSGTGNQIGTNASLKSPGFSTGLIDNGGVLLPDGNKIKTLVPGSTSLVIDAGALLPSTTVSAAAGTGDTTIAVTNAAQLGTGVYVLVDAEVMLITAVSGNVLTVTRAQSGTSAASHNSSANVFQAFDQRSIGFARLRGGAVDVGATEVGPIYPEAALTSAPNVPAAGATPYVFQVTWTDSDGGNIDSTTFDANDVKVTGSGYGAGVNPTSAVIKSGAGNSYVVEYTVAAPTGGWGGVNVGSYTVSVNPSQVFDLDQGASALGVAGSFKTAFATALVVDNTGDANDGNFTATNLTLREAIAIANTNGGFTDSITFDAGVFGSATTITVANGVQSIIDSVIITGPAAALTLNASPVVEQITVAPNQSLTLSNMKFTNFSAASAGGVITAGASTSISLTNVNFTSNTSSSTGGGAIAVTGNSATVSLSSVTFNKNTATTSGGAIHIGGNSVTVNVANSTFTGNTSSSVGGAIRGGASSTFNLSNSTFTGNTAAAAGGVFYSSGASNTVTLSSDTFGATGAGNGNTAGSSGGGAISMIGSSITFGMTSSTFTNNTAGSSGGAVRLSGASDSVTVTSSTLTGSTATGIAPAMYLSTSATVSISGSTFSNNTGTSTSSAIRTGSTSSVTITNSTFSGNTTSSTGGALYLNSANTVSISGSQILNNTAAFTSAGIYFVSGSITLTNDTLAGNTTNSTAGAFYISTSPSTVTLTNDVFSKNTGSTAGGVYVSASSVPLTIDGVRFDQNRAGTVGGLYVAGSSETTTVNHSMFSGNVGTTTHGGMYVGSTGTLTIQNSTFANNVAASNGGGLTVNTANTTIKNSTFAGNIATDGAGIRINSFVAGQTVSIYNSTVANNNATGSSSIAGYGGISGSSTVPVWTMFSNIVANNTGTVSNDIGLTVAAQTLNIAGDHNLVGIQGGSWAFTGSPNQVGSVSSIDPGLFALGDNAGYQLLDGTYVQTMALNSGSLARDAGSNPLGLTRDERDSGPPVHPRLLGADYDVGAFEATPVPGALAGLSLSNTPIVAGPTSYDVTVTFKDAISGIKVSTIDVNDIKVQDAFTGITYTATTFTVDSSNPNIVLATYTFTPPANAIAGQWDASDTSFFKINLAGVVTNNDPTPVAIPTGQVGSFYALLGSKAMVVTSNGDTDDSIYTTGNLTLREAINFSNINVNNLDSITFNLGAASTISLTSGYQLTDPLNVTGPGASSVTITGNDSFRIFNVNMPAGAASVDMSGLTLTHGRAANGPAINMTDGQVNLSNMVFSLNTSTSLGGAIMFTTGTLNVTGSTFQGNTAGSSGGAIYGSDTAVLTLTNDQFIANTANGVGGAVYIPIASSIVTIDPTIFKNNRGTTGGAIYLNGGSTTLIDQSYFTGNTATSARGGAIYWSPNVNGTLTVTNSTFEANTATSQGGALLTYYGNTTIQNSTFSGNRASNGGAISTYSGTGSPSLELDFVTVSGNTATAGVGGINVASTVTFTTFNATIDAKNVGTTTADLKMATGSSLNGDYNLIGVQDASWVGGGSFNKIGTKGSPIDPLLNALLDDGTGYLLPDGTRIKTMAISSPASLAYNNGGGNTFGLQYDERGIGHARDIPSGKADIGAYEHTTFPQPSAILLSAPNILAPGNGAETITIEYIDLDGGNIDTSTFDNNDIKVTGTGFGSQTVTMTGFSGAGNDYTVTYTVTAPAGGWGGTNIGAFQVVMQPTQVYDADDTLPVDPGTLGQFVTAFPTVLTVDLQGDADDGNYTVNNLTLREAILLSNQNLGLDTINFNASKFNGTVVNVATTMNITDDVVINGAGANLAKYSGQDLIQILNIQSTGTVTISGLTLTHGKITGGGAAIGFTSQTVTLNNMTLSNNSASGIGGAVNFTTGSLTVTNSTLSSNTAGNGGAVGFSTGQLLINSGSTLIGNTASVGGAIYTNDTSGSPTSSVTVLNSTLSGNTGTTDGGALYVGTATVDIETSIVKANIAPDSALIRPEGTSGNLLLPQITINNSLVSGNTSTGASHGLVYAFWGMTMNISNSTVVGNSCAAYGLLEPYEGAQISLINSTFTNNKTQYGVVGPYHFASGTPSITIANCTIVGNTGTSSYAGGVSEPVATPMTIDSSIIAGNVGGLAASPDIYTIGSTTITGDNNVIGLHYTGYTFTGTNNHEGATTATLELPGVFAFSDNGGINLPDGSRLPTMRPRGGTSASFDPAGNKHVLYAYDDGVTTGFSGNNNQAQTNDERGPGYARDVNASGNPGVDVGAVQRYSPFPLVTFVSPSSVTVVGSTPNTVVVQYTDNNKINASSIDINDITITGPSGNLTITSVAKSSAVNATPLTATYTFTVPGGGTWLAPANGAYSVSINANQVFDTDPSPNAIAAGQIGTFNVNISLPIATLVSPTLITTPGSTLNTAVVTYSTPSSLIDVSKIDTSDIVITGPGAVTLPVTGVTYSPLTNGSPITATYTFDISSLPGSKWSSAQNGAWSVGFVANQIADTAGQKINASTATFNVAIGKLWHVTLLSDSNTADGADTTGQSGDLRYCVTGANNETGAIVDTIVFDTTVFGTSQTIPLTAVEPTITHALLINGPGVNNVVLNAAASAQIFNIGAADVTMSDMALQGNGSFAGTGAAINFTTSVLTLSNIRITGATSTSNGGGIAFTTGTLNASGLTVQNSQAVSGGAIYFNSGTANIRQSKINSNSATSLGGGIYISSTGTLNLTESTMNGNTSTSDGGAIYNFSGGNNNIVRSTISNNVSNVTAGQGGGGIYLYGGTSTIISSTFANNTSNNSPGGGIVMLGGSALSIFGSTFSGNTAGTSLGGGIAVSSGTLSQVVSTIISANSATTGPDLSGTVGAFSYSLISNTAGATGQASSGGTGSIYNQSAGLGSLSPNGGLTLTMLPGSAPIGTGLDIVFGNLSGAATSGDTTVTVTGGISQAFLNEYVRVDSEIVRITAINGSTITVARGQDGTTAAAHSTGANIYMAYDQRGIGFRRAFQGTVVDIGAVQGDHKSPSGKMTAIPAVTVSGSTPNSVVVTYVDDGGILSSTIGTGNITITGPTGPLSITGFTKSSNSNVTPLTATYTFNPPSGNWSSADNGTWSVNVTANSVEDTNDNLFVAAGSVGTFNVGIGGVFVVTNTNDAGLGSLRQAVLNANSASAASNTISFDSTVFNTAQTITLTSGELLDSDVALIINGPGADKLTVSGNNASRIFHVNNGANELDINGMTITGGTFAGMGGAILVGTGDTLTLNNVTMSGNNASTGGAIGVDASVSPSTANVRIANSTLSGNSASSAGGAVYFLRGMTLSVINSTLANNNAGTGVGGAIGGFTTSSGKIYLHNSTVTGNNAATGGAMRFTGVAYSAGILDLESTIVTGNTGASGVDIYGPSQAGWVTSNFSVVGAISNGAAALAGANNLTVGTDPLLNPLANNGGQTQTMSLQTLPVVSPAQQAGSATLTTITANMTVGDTAMTVADANVFVIGMYVKIDSEIVKVTSTTGTLIGVARAQSGTTAAAHTSAASVNLAYDQRGLGHVRVSGAAADIGAFEVIPPTGTLNAANVTSGGASTYAFSVVYADNFGVDTTTIGTADVTVTGPGVGSPFTPTGVTVTGSGTSVTATYTISAPGGLFDTPDNGTYTVTMNANQVADLDGGAVVASGTLGTYQVNISAVAPPTVVSVVLDEGTGNTNIFGVNGTIQRSEVRRIIVTFSTPVTFTGANAFSLVRSASSLSSPAGGTGPVSLTTNPASGTASVVTITFNAGTFVDSTKSLQDGRYDFNIDATKVSNGGGQLNGNGTPGTDYHVNGSNLANKFYRFYGDENGDGGVDQTDYLAFRNALSNGPNTVFDFNGDGDVDQTDYLRFRQNLSGAP